MSSSGYPSLDDIYRDTKTFAARHSRIARLEPLGASPEGREVPAVLVTDPDVPHAEKQVALVVCGRHGSELGTRVVGGALLDWLATDEATPTRQRQVVIVVPVANPDGCVREAFWAPDDGLSETEETTILQLAQRWQPDAVLDVHSWGGVLDGEAIVAAATSDLGEDVSIYHALGGKMLSAAARRGYPFLMHEVPREPGYNNFFCGACYERFHSVVFGMEVNHSLLTPEETADSGTAIIVALLMEGNDTSPGEGHTGYPNGILLGDSFTSIRPVGDNAVQRRASRATLWQSRRQFSTPVREFIPPSTIRIEIERSAPLPFALVCRIRGYLDPKVTQLNGRDADATTFADNCSTYVSVEICPGSGDRQALRIEW